MSIFGGSASASDVLKQQQRDDVRRRSSIFKKIGNSLITPVEEEEESLPPSELEDYDLLDDIVDCIRNAQGPDQLISDRRYRLRSFPSCFIGKSLVTWLIEQFYKNIGVGSVLAQHGITCPDRASALKLGDRLWDARMLTHVAKAHSFKDGELFYRLKDHESDDRKKVPDLVVNCYLRYIQKHFGFASTVQVDSSKILFEGEALFTGKTGYVNPVYLIITAKSPTLFIFRSVKAAGKKLKLLLSNEEFKRLTKSAQNKGAPNQDVANVSGANPMPTISAAIRKGVALFNNGQDEACFDVYKQTAYELIGKSEYDAFHATLRKALADADVAPDASQKAWALRKAFDVIIAPYMRGGGAGQPIDELVSNKDEDREKKKDKELDKRDKDVVINGFLVPYESIKLSGVGYSLSEVEMNPTSFSPKLKNLFETTRRDDVPVESFQKNRDVSLYFLHLIFGPDAATQQLALVSSSLHERDELMALLVNLHVEFRVRSKPRLSDVNRSLTAPTDSSFQSFASHDSHSDDSKDEPSLSSLSDKDKEKDKSKRGKTTASTSNQFLEAVANTNTIEEALDLQAQHEENSEKPKPSPRKDEEKGSDQLPQLSLSVVLETPQYRLLFARFLDQNESGSSLRFLSAVDAFRLADDDIDRGDSAIKVFRTFVSAQGLDPVAIDTNVRRIVEDHIARKEFSADMFDGAYAAVVKVLKSDTFARFMRCDEYRELMDMLGLKGMSGRINELKISDKKRDRHRVKVLSERTFRRRPSFSLIPQTENLGDLDSLVDAIRNAGLIKDRRHHFKKYLSCLVGSSLVDWLTINQYASNRQAAVAIGQRLCDAMLLRHVTDECDFEDSELLYRLSPLDAEGEERYPKVGAPPVQLCVSVAELVWNRDSATHLGYVLLKGVKYTRLFGILTGAMNTNHPPELYLFRTEEHTHAEAVLDLSQASAVFLVNDKMSSLSSACYLQLLLPPSAAPSAQPVPSQSSTSLYEEESEAPGSGRSKRESSLNNISISKEDGSSPDDSLSPGPANASVNSLGADPSAATSSTNTHCRSKPRLITFRIRREEKQKWFDALENVGLSVRLQSADEE